MMQIKAHGEKISEFVPNAWMDLLDQSFSKLRVHYNHLEDLLKHRWLDLTPEFLVQ